MSKQWQIRRGTTAENDSFIGAIGEITMDTQKNEIRLHDGLTQGGKIFGDTVIEFQAPSSTNNYTWYRKYASGWVEQGGLGTGNNSIALPVEMSDTNYTLIGAITQNDNASLTLVFQSKATTGFYPRTTYRDSEFNYGISWQASGMAL